MNVQVKTPTRTQLNCLEMQFRDSSFSSTEIKKSKDDSSLARIPHPISWKRRCSQVYYKDEAIARRKRLRSTGPLPSKFLNGGSIDDPLNLNGLDSSELGKQLNAVTPQSSPLPFSARRESVEVRIPVNFSDPLNLNDSDEKADLDKMIRKRKQRNRHKKKEDCQLFSPQKHLNKDKSLMEALKIDVDPQQCIITTSTPKETIRQRGICDKIVSPVIRQVSPKSKKCRRTYNGGKTEISSTAISPKIDKKSSPRVFKTPNEKHNPSCSQKQHPKFIYGNYNRYYGYRNPQMEPDNRLKIMKREWFEGKSALDIGCNVGQVTLALAKDFSPAKIVGIDIDPKLIAAARKNIRYYMSLNVTDTTKFPLSNVVNYGPIVAPPITNQDPKKLAVFPHNVLLKQGNYVLENDELLDLQKEEYDVILALSITKWVHFNWGDDGLKRFFKRVYIQLRPGGRFILEPQPWSSYKKKKKLTETIFKNFQNIKLKPEQFTEYLLSREVGFITCNMLVVPFNASKGFRRSVLVYQKSETVHSSPWSEVGNVTPMRTIHHPTLFENSENIISEDSTSESQPASLFSNNNFEHNIVTHVTSDQSETNVEDIGMAADDNDRESQVTVDQFDNASISTDYVECGYEGNNVPILTDYSECGNEGNYVPVSTDSIKCKSKEMQIAVDVVEFKQEHVVFAESCESNIGENTASET